MKHQICNQCFKPLCNQQPCYDKLFVFSCLMCLSQSKWLINAKCPTIQLTENQVLLTCLSATPTPAIAWLCGPPWSDGNTAKSIFLSKSYLISGWKSGIKSHCTKDLSYCITMYPGTYLKFPVTALITFLMKIEEIRSLRFKVAVWQRETCMQSAFDCCGHCESRVSFLRRIWTGLQLKPLQHHPTY